MPFTRTYTRNETVLYAAVVLASLPYLLQYTKMTEDNHEHLIKISPYTY